jgi:tripartite-type tricarboxylate transporter receptor subunit TctC
MAESGLPGYEEYNWYGVLAPKGTPQSIIDKLHDEIVKALGDTAVATLLEQQGAEIIGNSPAEFSVYITAQAQKYADVVHKANIAIKN